jgi:replicative DNA helicase
MTTKPTGTPDAVDLQRLWAQPPTAETAAAATGPGTDAGTLDAARTSKPDAGDGGAGTAGTPDAAATTKLNYQTAADIFDDWRDDLLCGTPPTFYPIGEGAFSQIEVGPGIVNLFGGAPGSGKTAFTMQAVCDALRLTPGLKALVANVEMTPRVLLDRTLARLAGIDLTLIRYRRLDASHGTRLDAGLATLESFADRLAFLGPPFTLDGVAAAADAFDAKLLLLDYAQRFEPPGEHADKRNSVNRLMDFLRMFADAGLAVLVVAAVARTKDAKGRSSYDPDGLGLASFRESSELEFGSDSVFMLAPDGKDAGRVVLRCLKNRHGSTQDLPLRFDKRRQAFTPLDAAAETTATKAKPDGKLQAELRSLWNGTATAADEEGDDHEF